MRRSSKAFADRLASDWGPWTAAHFQTEGARNDFLCSVANTAESGWAAEAMTADDRSAQVRWRRGGFLRLNDVAHAHGGRIVVGVVQHRTF
jgi:hypothetical protein